jgi:hypothetical protein
MKYIFMLLLGIFPCLVNAQLFGYSSQEECINKELQKYKNPNSIARDAVIKYCNDKHPDKSVAKYRYEKFRLGKDVDLVCFEQQDKTKLIIRQRRGSIWVPDFGNERLEVIENNRVNTMRFWVEYPPERQRKIHTRLDLFVHPYYGDVHLTVFEVKRQVSHLYLYDCREE